MNNEASWLQSLQCELRLAGVPLIRTSMLLSQLDSGSAYAKRDKNAVVLDVVGYGPMNTLGLVESPDWVDFKPIVIGLSNPGFAVQSAVLKYAHHHGISYLVIVKDEDIVWLDAQSGLPIKDRPTDVVKFLHPSIARLLEFGHELLHHDGFTSSEAEWLLQAALLLWARERDTGVREWARDSTTGQFLALYSEACDHYQIEPSASLLGGFERVMGNLRGLVDLLPERQETVTSGMIEAYQEGLLGWEAPVGTLVQKLIWSLVGSTSASKEGAPWYNVSVGSTLSTFLHFSDIKWDGREEDRELRRNALWLRAVAKTRLVPEALGSRASESENGRYAGVLLVTSESEWQRNPFLAKQMLEEATHLVSPGGSIIALLPDSWLYTKAKKELRDHMLGDTIIRAIISIPNLYAVSEDWAGAAVQDAEPNVAARAKAESSRVSRQMARRSKRMSLLLLERKRLPEDRGVEVFVAQIETPEDGETLNDLLWDGAINYETVTQNS